MRSQAIWHPAALAVEIRQELVLSGTVNGGVLRCAGSGPYAVYLNGELVGRGLGEEIAAVAVWEAFDLATALREGKNVLLVFATGKGEGDWFRAEGEIAFSDGTERELNMGTPWQVRGVDAWQGMDGGYAYVAAVEPAEWMEATAVAGLELRTWAPLAAIEAEVWARAVVEFGEVDSGGAVEWIEPPQAMKTAKCVRREALLALGKTQTQVQARDADRAAYLVLDFGRVVSGFVRLRLRGRAGAVVDLGLARARGTVEARLRYVCKEGLQEWTFPPLMACRYMVVRVGQCAEEMEVDCVSLLERRVVVEARGHFETEGEDWARIGQVGARSLAACRREVYALSGGRPVYDWGKLYVLALNDFYTTGCSDTARAVLASGVAPVGGEQACFYALFAELVQRHTGDGGLAAELLSGVLNGLQAVEEATGALQAGAWQAMEALCRAASNGKGEVDCERAFHRARKGLQAVWNEERGLFADVAGSEECSRWVNALALYFDLVESGQRVRVAQALSGGELERVDDLWQAFFVAGALWRAGESEWALAYIEKEWGRLLDRPGRTWGEKAGRLEVQPGPEGLLAAHMLGVCPKAEGILEIRPQLAGRERAEGMVPTLHGDVDVAWGAYGGGFSLRVTLPHDGETHLSVPRRDRRFPQISINGETVWRNEKVHPNFFAQEFYSEEERVVMVVRKAGEYEVKVQ